MWYRLYCEICGYNQVTDGKDVKLIEYERSKIQGELPRLENNKTFVPKFKTLPKKYKCPGCGRLIGPKVIKEVEKKPDEKKVIYEENIDKRGAGGFERS